VSLSNLAKIFNDSKHRAASLGNSWTCFGSLCDKFRTNNWGYLWATKPSDPAFWGHPVHPTEGLTNRLCFTLYHRITYTPSGGLCRSTRSTHQSAAVKTIYNPDSRGETYGNRGWYAGGRFLIY